MTESYLKRSKADEISLSPKLLVSRSLPTLGLEEIRASENNDVPTRNRATSICSTEIPQKAKREDKQERRYKKEHGHRGSNESSTLARKRNKRKSSFGPASRPDKGEVPTGSPEEKNVLEETKRVEVKSTESPREDRRKKERISFKEKRSDKEKNKHVEVLVERNEDNSEILQDEKLDMDAKLRAHDVLQLRTDIQEGAGRNNLAFSVKGQVEHQAEERVEGTYMKFIPRQIDDLPSSILQKWAALSFTKEKLEAHPVVTYHVSWFLEREDFPKDFSVWEKTGSESHVPYCSQEALDTTSNHSPPLHHLLARLLFSHNQYIVLYVPCDESKWKFGEN
eukprot:TRINITY_DN9466_c0_g1_i1.p1 TRINITY_DN9466_c0_g1~~TRINITY_DN9466_c0_g1_i1.p1  ORF type:complete len:337 (-),score=67.74 TRINITY_DN9466_c0_g1_i1:90-1100(-)